MKVYVASSWKNNYQPAVVDWLTKRCHEVYDFRHPVPGNDGFSWSQIDENWRNWSVGDYLAALNKGPAQQGFYLDFGAMNWADCCVMVTPCGISASTEFGWFCGRGKPAYILMKEIRDYDLMYKMANGIVREVEQLAFYTL